jgi:hypothetical protein
VTNAIVRELVYLDAVGEKAAHQIATFVLIAMITLYVIVLESRWPIPSARDAFAIGGAWALATVAFEFLFGHYVDPSHFTWSELAANYNILQGRLWILVPASMVFMPAAARQLRLKRASASNPTDRHQVTAKS